MGLDLLAASIEVGGSRVEGGWDLMAELTAAGRRELSCECRRLNELAAFRQLSECAQKWTIGHGWIKNPATRLLQPQVRQFW